MEGLWRVGWRLVTSAAASDGSSSPEQDREIIAHLPDGVAVIDNGATIRWANSRFAAWCGGGRGGQGCDFFAALDLPSQEMASFQESLRHGQPATATLRTSDNRYFDVQASVAFPVTTDTGNAMRTVVSVRDVTHAILEQQKRAGPAEE